MDKLFFSIKDAAKVKTFAELYILAFVTTVTNKDPERYCVLTNRMLADVGIPGNTAKRALDNLVKSGLITYEIKLNKRYGTKERRIRRVDQSSKMETCEMSKMEYSESSKMDISESSILDAPKFQNGIMESSKMETSSISTKVDLIKVEDQSRVARERNFDETEKKSESHFTLFASDPTLKNSAQTAPKKSTQTKCMEYPKTVEAVRDMVIHFRDTHPKVEDIKNLDVDYYAQAIFDYYVAPFNDGKWRDNKQNLIKAPYRAICNWLNRDLGKGALRLMSEQPKDRWHDEDYLYAQQLFAEIEAEQNGQPLPPRNAEFEVVDDSSNQPTNLFKQLPRRQL